MMRKWEEIREEVLKRDNRTCRRCFNAECISVIKKADGSFEDHVFVKVDVHHIIPRRRSLDDRLINLVTLCDSCHKTVDNLYKRYGLTKYMRKWAEENAIGVMSDK